VDDASSESKYYLDSFTLEENAALLERLHRVVGEAISN
jgi:hypothetical protein